MTNLSAAILARDSGMAQALGHAEREAPDWGSVALAFVHKYARSHAQFVAEDCIAAAIAWGLASPVPKAWGPVFRRAARLGIITRVGYEPSKRRHCSPTPLWHSNVYREKA